MLRQLISTFWMKIKSNYFILFICLAAAIYLVFNIQPTFSSNTSNYLLSDRKLKQYREKINIIDFNVSIEANISCVKTKAMLGNVRTTICIHQNDYVSNHYKGGGVYEESMVATFLRLLTNNPEYGFIDIGGNIGTYTMFVAAMNRSVISIECFQPNYLRITKAIQMENLQNRVILVGNAIYSKSGQYLDLSPNPGNIGGQAVRTDLVQNKSTINPYVVQTIRFDDLLPLIKETKIRSFFMKIDIEGSEFHVFNTSAQAFDYLKISFIMMEWTMVKNPKEQAMFVIDFLTSRGYIPMKDTCSKLNLADAFNNWPIDVFWIKKSEIGKILFG